MRQFLIVVCSLLFAINAYSQQNQLSRPKLVVGIVVDQMRWDYLYKYYDRYSDKGFRRLLSDGFSCEQTMINYLPAYTAPGHACVYTGTVPSVHGIAGNDWMDKLTGRRWYCTEDTAVSAVGGSQRAGRMSPRNLLSTTVTDELRLATNMKSKVVGVAIKDRGSILPAGHLGKAYWFDDSTGGMITSSYYESSLPDWLVAFNARRLPQSYLKEDWKTLYPLNTYVQSLPDNNPYEGRFSGEDAPVFPHPVSRQRGLGTLRRIPAGNTYTLEAARAALDGEQLGQGRETDFLCVSLSSSDYIGHMYAPDAVEVEDMYLRLDKDLGAFLDYLDRKVGKGSYVVFLTADHGGAHNSHYLQDINVPSDNVSDQQLKEMILSGGNEITLASGKKIDLTRAVKGLENYQIFLDEPAIEAAGLSVAEVSKAIRQRLEKQPGIAYVIDLNDPASAAVPQMIMERAINGYNRLRSGNLLIIFHPGWYNGYSPTGTTHGTWHPYDTHIPLLWYGWNIPVGRTNRTVHMEDIAPTISALLHIPLPNGCIGNVITEIVK